MASGSSEPHSSSGGDSVPSSKVRENDQNRQGNKVMCSHSETISLQDQKTEDIVDADQANAIQNA
jgi:hypothetical protein